MGEILDAIERARLAQQLYERRIPVQLEIGELMELPHVLHRFEVFVRDSADNRRSLNYTVETFAQAEMLASADTDNDEEIIKIEKDFDG